MRYNEILKEFLIKVGKTTVHRNPVKPQVLSMFQDAKARIDDEARSLRNIYSLLPELRGLVHGKKIYLWNSEDGIHFDIMNNMVKLGIIDHPEISPRNIIPTYSGFYLRHRTELITVHHYYNNGKGWEGNPEVLNKWLDRWNS